jgi:YidC/Oxa1 family membrane protein insertase
MEFLGNIYNTLIYYPQLNLLQFFYNITGDIGVSILLLSLSINIILVPIFASAYINGQKMKVLQPLLTALREKYKDDPKLMLSKLQEFYKEHGVSNNSIFLILIFQLLFATALWNITKSISTSELVNGVIELNGLYSNIFGRGTTNFDRLAFNFLNIGDTATNHIWLPIITAGLSYLYGLYTFKLAPKPKLLPEKYLNKIKIKKKEDKPAAFDPEAFQKSMEFQTMYFIPALMFFLNVYLTVGVNIYFLVVNIISLVRQIVLTNYYSNHTDKLITKIIESDPKYDQDAKDEPVDGDIQLAEPITIITKENKKSSKKVSKSTKNKKSKSLSKST